MPDTFSIDYIYIFDHYRPQMNLMETAAMKHAIICRQKNQALTEGTFGKNKAVMELLKDGYDQFKINIAEKYFREHPGKVYFNYCPSCGKPARTLHAKQCRFCSTSWRNGEFATFEIKTSFYVAGKGFYVLGELLNGHINTGMKLHLSGMGLGHDPVITHIEDAVHQAENGTIVEGTGLCIGDLTPEEAGHLAFNSPFSHPIFITPINDVQ